MWCSRKCKDAARHRERRARAVAEAGERRCLVCHAVIPETVTLKAKCCSRECGVIYQNRKKAEARLATWSAEGRRCQRCGKAIPVPEHGKRRTIYCSAECKKQEMDARWRLRSPHYMRQYIYGLSQERFEAMLAEQDGRCAICRSPDWPGKGNFPNVDHNGETGKVRALLCGNCNKGIGLLGHDPARLRAAAEYLERHQE